MSTPADTHPPTPTRTHHGRIRVDGRAERLTTTVLAVAVCLLAVLCPSAAAAGDDSTSAHDTAVEVLLARHAPLLRLVEQPEPCGKGEPYQPMRPDALFGREGFVLRGPDSTIDEPVESDLPSGAADSWFLDLPGDALRPGCRYEQLFDALQSEPTMYGRVVSEPGRPGELVVQYWFFYLYNDWNDRHEGDWEMVQLVFAASTAEEALDSAPERAMYAQHEGGEISEWRDDVLETVDGVRPVVYVAAGSHASYFSSDRWFGKSAQSGFGCDDTRRPSYEIEPDVEILRDGALPRWAEYTGHWGERRPSFNNGPTGPITKLQWSSPLTWMETQGRRGAANLPDGGSTVTDAFCAAARGASVVLFGLLDRPAAVGIVAGIVLCGIVLLARRTRWRPSVTAPLLVRRRAGQMLTSAFTVVRSRYRLFVPIGALLIVGGLAAVALQGLLLSTTEVGDVADVADRRSIWGAVVALLIGSVTTVPTAAAVTVLSMLAARRLATSGGCSLRDLFGDLRTAWRAVLIAILLPPSIALLLVSVIGFPIAVFLLARWAVALPAAIECRRPLRRSAELTQGRRIRSGAITLTSVVWSQFVPVSVGIVALLVTDLSFDVVNLIAAVAASFVIPTVAVMQLMHWADLERRSSPEITENGTEPGTAAHDLGTTGP
ncbi:MAG: hypothetical protein RI958_2810 [Actinomycetota bacterium]